MEKNILTLKLKKCLECKKYELLLGEDFYINPVDKRKCNQMITKIKQMIKKLEEINKFGIFWNSELFWNYSVNKIIYQFENLIEKITNEMFTYKLEHKYILSGEDPNKVRKRMNICID